MARLLSQTVVLRHSTTTITPTTATTTAQPPFASLLFHRHRHRSTQSGKSQLIEIDLDSADGESEVLGSGIRKLEDLIHRIIVQRSAPTWLPFIPGSSYWVPPKRKPQNIVEWIGKLANPLTDEEALSLTTVRGWPSSTFFFPGGASEHPDEVKVRDASTDSGKVEDVSTDSGKVQFNSGNTSQSEDEEG